MLHSPHASEAAPRARSWWFACAVLFASIPPAMAFAHRSAPLFGTAAALLALAACAREGALPVLCRQAEAALLTRLGAAATVFLIYGALSIAWSPAPASSLYAYGEFLVAILAGFVLALSLPARAPRWLWILLAALAIGATWVLLIDLALGLPVRRAMGWRMNTFVYNRPALTLLVIAPPLLTALIEQRHRLLALAVAGFVAAAILQSESGAAKLGALVALGAYGAGRWLRPVALATATATIVLALALAPLAGDMLQRLLPSAAHQALATSNSQARVDIWRSFGAAVKYQPWFGAGFAPGSSFPDSPKVADLDPAYRTFLVAGHPHNGALQIWSELGAAGAFVAVLVLCLILRSLSGLPPASFAAGLAVFAAAAAVSFVGHGLWQGWWAASIGAAIVAIRMLAREERERAR
ncbi:MAG: O-antigen ligase protein [Microvirga sp.]|jgi:O-antigen ligase|nr:O-antigen ligase protein [Microvirga sp.]